ncbi:MAG: TonB-dependent receptor [Bacteroidetes bacterium]|jgi:outer membrane receptor protein involved in Fe transport|nr:TonB-dependent receptor [Bacteroidota bacterium]
MKVTVQGLLAALMLLTVPALAQESGKISGHVRDKATKEPLIGANVLLKGTRLGATTNQDGEYFILNVPPGSHEVSASYLGYQTMTQRGLIVNNNRTTTADFSLTETSVTADEVVVMAQRPEVEKEKTSTSDIIRSEEVLAVPGIRDLTSVLSLSSDVSESHFRGGREGEELYNLQGMGIVNPLSNASSFAPIMSALEEVEIITSGFSAQYGNAQSGVVNISMKEGRNDKWTARAEARVRAPGRKHFGPSVWDPKANPYLAILNSELVWSTIDSNSTNQNSKYYNSIGNGFDGRYGRDSTTLGQIAYLYWAKQSKRDMGETYDNLVDYSLDATMGGPLSENTRAFLAFHSENTWPMLPTPEPETKKQFMGNLVHDLGEGMTVRLSGAYTNEREFVFRSTSTTGFYSWIWDRTLGTTRGVTDNYQLGARFTYAQSAATFYEVKVNTLRTNFLGGTPVTSPIVYYGDFSKTWSIPYSSTPDNFSYANIDDDFRDERSRTISLDASMTSQMTNAHMLLAGIQANWFSLDVSNILSLKSSNGQRFERYGSKPMEFAVYLQDKMEFEGMIANIGLRFDLYNQNLFYYTDPYAPYRYINENGDTLTNKALADQALTPSLARLQPRLGISFPVSETMVFHVNYGSFVQRPPFSQTVFQQEPNRGFKDMVLGNPRLQPQVTNSYDIGLTQGLGGGFRIDVSGYYKDVRNLIQQAFYYDVQGFGYSTFVNRDYADIRGFRVSFARRQGMLTGTINYTYGVATGKNATPFNESPRFSESGTVVLPTAKDVLLDFDRTHNVVGSFVVNFDRDDLWWDPTVLSGTPFTGITLSATAFYRSGRPYTYDMTGGGALFNKRSPDETNMNMKITKEFERFSGVRASVYLEIFNVFNSMIYNYNAIFRKTRNTATGTFEENRNLDLYESDRAAMTYYEDPNHPGFLVDQTFLLYSNAPRSFQFGIVLNF